MPNTSVNRNQNNNSKNNNPRTIKKQQQKNLMDAFDLKENKIELVFRRSKFKIPLVWYKCPSLHESVQSLGLKMEPFSPALKMKITHTTISAA